MRVHNIRVIIKTLIIKEFEKIVVPKICRDKGKVNSQSKDYHSVLHFWEKKLTPYIEEIVNTILRMLHRLIYSENFIYSTIITNRKKKG